MSYDGVKQELKYVYGSTCMICERKLKKKECTFHHILPKSYGGQATFENGCILCRKCHERLHLFSYGTLGYTLLTLKIYFNLKKYEKQSKIGAYN